LGPKFPKTFKGKPFGTNLVLMSEPDSDHAHAPGGWLQAAPPTKPNSDPFPDINIQGTVVYEWNGDLNIAWSYTIDGVRMTHFGDHAHALTKKQLKQIGKTDIVFMSAPKPEEASKAMEIVRRDIRALNPRLVIWAHHIAPEKMPSLKDGDKLRKFFVKYFKKHLGDRDDYVDKTSYMELANVLQNANILNKELDGKILRKTSLRIDKKSLPRKTTSALFVKMLGKE